MVLTLLGLGVCALGHLSPLGPVPSAGNLRVYEAYSLVLGVVIILFTLFQFSRENARVERALRLDIVARERAERELAESRQAAITAAKMAALGEMSASVAHEVNNPLAAILLRAQRLDMLARTDTVDVAAVRKTAHDIDRTVDRIRRIVDALRAFARQGDEDPLRPERLAPIVEDTVELCNHRFRLRGIELTVDPIPDGLLVLCRGTQVAQVLLNLLSNAYDAVENQDERWVRMTVAARRRRGAHRRPRQRSGRTGGDRRAHHGAVLHDQGDRSRNRPRSVALRGDRGGPRRSPRARRRRAADALRADAEAGGGDGSRARLTRFSVPT